MYPERVCPTCGKTFEPTDKRQIYDTPYCRMKAARQRQKNELAPFDRTGMLEEIRKLDAETAHDIELLAVRAGKQLAEDILYVCYRAMQRTSRRLAVTDFASLIEEGAIKAKRRRKPKPN